MKSLPNLTTKNVFKVRGYYWIRFTYEQSNLGLYHPSKHIHITLSYNNDSPDINLHITKNKSNESERLEHRITAILKKEATYQFKLGTMSLINKIFKRTTLSNIIKECGSDSIFLPYEELKKPEFETIILNGLWKQFEDISKEKTKELIIENDNLKQRFYQAAKTKSIFNELERKYIPALSISNVNTIGGFVFPTKGEKILGIFRLNNQWHIMDIANLSMRDIVTCFISWKDYIRYKWEYTRTLVAMQKVRTQNELNAILKRYNKLN